MARSTLPHPGQPGPSRLARLATLPMGLALAGCFVVIDPRDVVETPAVNGVIREQGRPVSAALLWVSPVYAHGACEDLRLSTRTDSDGAFGFAETREHRAVEFVPLAPSTPAYTVQICVDAEAGPEPLYRETFRGALPRLVTLDCDLLPAAGTPPACTATLTGRQVPGYQGID